MPLDYDVDFGDSGRSNLLSRRSTLKSRVDGAAWTAADIDILKKTVIDVLSLLLDFPELTAEDREYSRALNADGIPNVPEYRHELLMGMDTDYQAAWRYDHDPNFPAMAAAEPGLMDAVLQGRTRYPYRESDPEIVDRSLARHHYRDLGEGELMPRDPLGRTAPRFTYAGKTVYTDAGNFVSSGTLSP